MSSVQLMGRAFHCSGGSPRVARKQRAGVRARELRWAGVKLVGRV